jgi:hypothetical protein
MINSRRMRWAGHVVQTGDIRNMYKNFVGNLKVIYLLGNVGVELGNNIKINLKEIGWGVGLVTSLN